MCGRVGCETLGVKDSLGPGTYEPAHLGLPNSQEDTTGHMTMYIQLQFRASRYALSKACNFTMKALHVIKSSHFQVDLYTHTLCARIIRTSLVCLLLTVPQSEILGLTVCRHSFVARSHTLSQTTGWMPNTRATVTYCIYRVPWQDARVFTGDGIGVVSTSTKGGLSRNCSFLQSTTPVEPFGIQWQEQS